MQPSRSHCRLPAAACVAAASLWLAPAPALAAEDAGVAGPAVVLLVLLGVALGAAGAYLWVLRRTSVPRDALASLPAPRQVLAARGQCLYANPAFRAAFGTEDRPLPEVLAEVLDDPRARSEVERIAEDARRGTPGRAELKLPLAGAAQDGAAWRQVSASPLAARPGSVLWAVDDILPERQMAQAVEAEQRRFLDMLHEAPIGFYALDAEGRFVFANDVLAKWLGLARDALEGRMAARDLVAGDLPSAAAPGDLLGDGAEQGEVVFKRRGGADFTARVAQTLERDSEGRVKRISAVVRNLAGERAAAEALGRAERRFDNFFELAPVGIALLDGRGLVTDGNEAMRAMAGLEDKLSGVPWTRLVAEQSRPLLEDLLSPDGPSALAEDVSPVEVNMAGGDTVCALYLTPMDHDADTPGGFVAHFIDTTEQKSLERQFVQSMKMQAVGQLAGGIAHDFNNLLTAMIGFSDLLLLRHKPGDQSFADIMQIKQNANRAANLVRQLLAFSRQQTLQAKILNITDILAELSHLLRRLIGENIDLKMVHGRDLGLIKADQGQLEQVIINLAVNARDAMPEGGTLTIRTDNVHFARSAKRKGETIPAGHYNEIKVTDSGCGVAQEDIDRIFDPFFTTKEVGAGTGLGLSTVYGIVRQTGGFVFVESKQGAGTTFTILLPHHAETEGEAADREAATEVSRDLSGVGTLLLVEDEDAVRAFSARALRSKGYNVLEARSGEAALELLGEQQKPIDLLITDVVMPRIDGPALVREVRGQRPDLKVIFISGYAETTFRERLDQGDGIHFLPKPFSLKQLAGKVKEVMRDSAAA